MKLDFIKMHGLGNDYVYFDCIEDPTKIPDPNSLAPIVADRHFGVGGDGIVLILKHNEADFEMRMFNLDGSESEMCGNAIRCVGKYVYDNGYTGKELITVQTGAGILELQMTIANGAVEKVRVDMGEPILNGPDIPVAVDKNPVVAESIKTADGTEYKMTCVSMGNPHAVIFVDEITDKHVLEHGKELEVHDCFPNRINVEFIKLISRTEVDMRVWERGSGETMACGTGASAVAVACVLNELTERKILVHLNGGDLEIEWADDNHVYMTGPATLAFNGVIEI